MGETLATIRQLSDGGYEIKTQEHHVCRFRTSGDAAMYLAMAMQEIDRLKAERSVELIDGDVVPLEDAIHHSVCSVCGAKAKWTYDGDPDGPRWQWSCCHHRMVLCAPFVQVTRMRRDHV